MRGRLRARTDPIERTDLERCVRPRAEERQPCDARERWIGRGRNDNRHRLGPERVAPGEYGGVLRERTNDARKIVRKARWCLPQPELAERVPAHDGDPMRSGLLRNGLVEVGPAVVPRDEDHDGM